LYKNQKAIHFGTNEDALQLVWHLLFIIAGAASAEVLRGREKINANYPQGGFHYGTKNDIIFYIGTLLG